MEKVGKQEYAEKQYSARNPREAARRRSRPLRTPAASLVSMSGRTGMWLKKGKRGQTGLHRGEALLPPPSPWDDSGQCIFKKISCGIETDLDSFFQNSL